MANLTRYTQRPFGTLAGFNQMAEYGSFAFGTPMLYDGATITPAIVQTLGNYDSGWFAAVEGAYSPAIEDMNALCYLFAYQLTYLLQWGIPQYDAGTTYNIGSIVNDGSGVLYKSLTNVNMGNTPSGSPANWGAPFVPDGFMVGVTAKTGNVVSSISNPSAVATDGAQLQITTGGTSANTQTLTANGDFFNAINSATPASTNYHLQTNVGGGAIVDVMVANTQTGIVNFPLGLLFNNTPVFNQINQTIITTSQNYTPSTGTVFVQIEIVGGGGGGGGVPNGAGNISVGAGGGGAGYCRIILPVASASGKAFVIGTGGTAGSNTGGGGGDGTDTTFDASGLNMVASHGQGGTAATGANGTSLIAFRGAGGGAASGTVNIVGESGQPGFTAPSVAVGGSGGASFLCTATPQQVAVSGGANTIFGGFTGHNYGGGGSGACASATSAIAGAAGGAGGPGVAIITEYISA